MYLNDGADSSYCGERKWRYIRCSTCEESYCSVECAAEMHAEKLGHDANEEFGYWRDEIHEELSGGGGIKDDGDSKRVEKRGGKPEPEEDDSDSDGERVGKTEHVFESMKHGSRCARCERISESGGFVYCNFCDECYCCVSCAALHHHDKDLQRRKVATWIAMINRDVLPYGFFDNLGEEGATISADKYGEIDS